MRVAQREVGAHRAADGTARVSEALDAHAVQRGEQTVGEVGDGRRGVGGGSAVPRQVVPEDSPVLRELGYLAVPHVPGRSEGRTDDQDRRIVRPVEAVLEQLPRLRALGLRALLALGLGLRALLALRLGLRALLALGLGLRALRAVRHLRVLRGAVRCLRQPGVQRCLREPRLPRRLRVLRTLGRPGVLRRRGMLRRPGRSCASSGAPGYCWTGRSSSPCRGASCSAESG